MDFSTDLLILLKQYCLALSCIDCKKSSNFFPVLQQYNVLVFYFYKSCFLPQYFLKIILNKSRVYSHTIALKGEYICTYVYFLQFAKIF